MPMPFWCYQSFGLSFSSLPPPPPPLVFKVIINFIGSRAITLEILCHEGSSMGFSQWPKNNFLPLRIVLLEWWFYRVKYCLSCLFLPATRHLCLCACIYIICFLGGDVYFSLRYRLYMIIADYRSVTDHFLLNLQSEWSKKWWQLEAFHALKYKWAVDVILKQQTDHFNNNKRYQKNELLRQPLLICQPLSEHGHRELT